MRGDYTVKTAALGLVCLAVVVVGAGGCECCPSTIDVGVSGELELWTWDPVTEFPATPNKKVDGSELKPLNLYLAKVQVTNNSKVEDIRGAQVAFTWARLGLFDEGTPVGSVGVDLTRGETKWVSSPWFPTGFNTELAHRCFSVRVFHPCDKDLDNNWRQRNIDIEVLGALWQHHIVGFVADFTELDGRLALKVEAPDGVRAYVAREALPEGAAETVKQGAGIDALSVKRGVPQKLSLIVENVGAKFKPGDKFNVTVSAVQDKKEVSRFTVEFQVAQGK